MLTYSSTGDANETSTTSTLQHQEDTATTQQQQQEQPAAPLAATATATSNGNGTSTSSTTSSSTTDDKDAPKHKDWVPDASTLSALQFTPLSSGQKGWTNFKLAFALPWRRFKPEAVLTFKLEGEISDQLQGRFSPGFSMPQILDSLEKAAVDPRIKGIAVEINPLAVSVVFVVVCCNCVWVWVWVWAWVGVLEWGEGGGSLREEVKDLHCSV